jgi:hypothetical protein
MNKTAALKKQSPQSHKPPPPIPAGLRRFLGLLGFLTKAEVDAIFTQIPITTTSPTLLPAELWKQCQQHVSSASPLNSDAATILVVPEEAVPVVEQIKLRQSYKRWYEAVSEYTFAIVPFDQLLSPQWEADLDYVDEMTSRAPQPGDWSAAFTFAMQEGSIGEPVVNQNQVIFSSHRRDLFCNQIPEVRAVEAGVYEIVARAQSRPNYIQVARFGGRIVLMNGVHKALAMKQAGFNEIPCVLREAGSHPELGLNPVTSFLRQEYLLSSRPALVADFFSEDLAAPLLMRAMDQALRVIVVVEPMTIPALS